MAQGIGNFIDRVQLGDDEAHQIAIGSSAYGVCSSLGSAVEKVVSLPGFALNPGTTIHVKFSNANSATSPTLNVNSTGAKPIVQYGTEAISSWFAGAVLTLTYDGTSWVRDYDTTYTISPGSTNGTIRVVPNADEGYEVSIPGLAALAYKSELLESDIPDLSWTKITSDKPTTLSGYGITDAFIDNNNNVTLGSKTITPIISVNGYTGSEITISPSDLGLSNALHFIGITSTTLTDGSTATTLVPKSANSLSKTTGFVDGDVVIDEDQLREYVFTNNAWILLGFTTSTTYDSNSINTSTVNEPTWVSRITQATDGTISVERATLGILPITKGGTGVDSFTPNQVILSDNIDGTTGLVSRAYIDNSTATALSTTSNFVTEKTIYYGLPTINDAHDYTSDTEIYAPTTGGTSGQILISSGVAPVWTQAAILNSAASAVANEDAYTTLTLGNSGDKGSTISHSEGKIILYSAATGTHTIIGNSATSNYTHILPNSDGILVQVDLTVGAGSNTQSIYISNSGIVTPLTYTANRLYYSASTTSFEATQHYADETKIGINITDWPENNGVPITDNFYVNGGTSISDTLKVAGATILSSNVGIGCAPDNNAIDPHILSINGSIVIVNENNTVAHLDVDTSASSLTFVPGTSNTGSIGTTNNRWNSLYLSNILDIDDGSSSIVLEVDDTITDNPIAELSLTSKNPTILLNTSDNSKLNWSVQNQNGLFVFSNENNVELYGNEQGLALSSRLYINPTNLVLTNTDTLDLYVAGNSQLSGQVGIGTTIESTGAYILRIAGSSLINGDLIPEQDAAHDLGLQDTNNSLRWKNLYLSHSINIFNGTSSSVLASDGTLTLTAGTPQILLETTSASADSWYIKNTAGTFTIENDSQQIIKGTAYGFKINDALYINQEVPSSNIYSLYVNGDTQFIGDINQTGNVIQTGTYYFASNGTNIASISAVQDALHLAAENISTDTIPYLDFNGHIYPTSNNEYNLGASNKRWAKLYVGTAASYGDAYTPVYWNDGVPAAVTPIQYCEFTIGSGNRGVQLTHAAFTAASYVTQIVVTSGDSNLNSAIAWESAAGYINLTCSATSGAVDGYILVSRGDAITATQTAIT